MKILGVIFIGIFCVQHKDLIKAKQIGYCDYQCTDGGGCKVTYTGPNRRGNTKGSCFPLSFGGSCSGIPRECQQNCHTVINCREPQGQDVPITKPQACKTQSSGPGTGKDCVFPFKYKGQTYKKCTKVDTNNGRAWCAYNIQPGTEFPKDNQHWGDCENGCPGTDGKEFVPCEDKEVWCSYSPSCDEEGVKKKCPVLCGTCHDRIRRKIAPGLKGIPKTVEKEIPCSLDPNQPGFSKIKEKCEMECNFDGTCKETITTDHCKCSRFGKSYKNVNVYQNGHLVPSQTEVRGALNTCDELQRRCSNCPNQGGYSGWKSKTDYPRSCQRNLVNAASIYFRLHG
jgi:hypothetical protein